MNFNELIEKNTRDLTAKELEAVAYYYKDLGDDGKYTKYYDLYDKKLMQVSTRNRRVGSATKAEHEEYILLSALLEEKTKNYDYSFDYDKHIERYDALDKYILPSI